VKEKEIRSRDMWRVTGEEQMCRGIGRCSGALHFLRIQPEPRMRLAVRGVPKRALRTHSA